MRAFTRPCVRDRTCLRSGQATWQVVARPTGLRTRTRFSAHVSQTLFPQHCCFTPMLPQPRSQPFWSITWARTRRRIAAKPFLRIVATIRVQCGGAGRSRRELVRKLLFLNASAPSRPAADSLLLLSRRGAPGKCKENAPPPLRQGSWRLFYQDSFWPQRRRWAERCALSILFFSTSCVSRRTLVRNVKLCAALAPSSLGTQCSVSRLLP